MKQEMQRLRIESSAGGEMIRVEVKARMTLSEGKARWMYAQTIVEGEAPVAEMLEVALEPDGRVREAGMKRVGGFTLRFAEGQAWSSEMATPAGRLSVMIRTESIEGHVKDSLVDLTISYRLFLGGEENGKTTIRYTSQPFQ